MFLHTQPDLSFLCWDYRFKLQLQTFSLFPFFLAAIVII